MITNLDDPRIPRLGEHFAPLSWIPISIVQCKCQTERPQPILIVTSFQSPTICGLCGWAYYNEAVVPTPTGQFTVRVGAIVPAPPPTDSDDQKPKPNPESVN